jgi:glycosyltransferase involved in cell wall biosynthesis
MTEPGSEERMQSTSVLPESPFVSVIIPCRNEAKWIEKCLESVAASDYPKDRLEVFVIDGMSNDGTRDIVASFAAGHPFIRLLENPKRTAPAALNIGIAAARGEIIMRMDAHTEFRANYIGCLVHWLQKSDADNVGGWLITRPSADTAKAKALTLGETHLFGVGNASYRLGVSEPRQVDTVPFGCYRREVFDRIGLFDEELVRGQDLELNLRLRKAGGLILLVPDAVSCYHSRDSLHKLWRTHFQNGYFNVLILRKTKGRLTLRHMIPPLFVLVLLAGGLLAPWSKWMLMLFLCTLTAYAIPLLAFSLAAAVRHGPKCGCWLAVVFLTLHFANGFGVMRGIADFIILRKSIAEERTQTISITR